MTSARVSPARSESFSEQGRLSEVYLPQESLPAEVGVRFVPSSRR